VQLGSFFQETQLVTDLICSFDGRTARQLLLAVFFLLLLLLLLHQ